MLVVVAVGGAITVNATIDASDPTQTGRLGRDAVTSTCIAPKSSPGLLATTGARHYDSYTYTNSSGSSQCVTVTLTQTSGNDAGLFTAAYLGSFNSADPGMNYLADSGASSALNTAGTYSFLLAAGQTAVVVVHEVNPDGCLGCGYTLTIDAVTAATFASARLAHPPRHAASLAHRN
jgi:hypothetical protein